MPLPSSGSLKNGVGSPLREFILKALSILREGISFDEASVFEKVLDFYRERYRQMMLRSDYSPDLVEAVISAEFDQLHHLRYRFGDLKKFVSGFSDLEPLALMFKRMMNILKNQTGAPLSILPSKGAERVAALEEIPGDQDEFHRLTEHKKYFEALNLLVTLKEPVDEFLKVEILTKKMKN
jgi:glycyl-tRNA synthetase beta subunit